MNQALAQPLPQVVVDVQGEVNRLKDKNKDKEKHQPAHDVLQRWRPDVAARLGANAEEQCVLEELYKATYAQCQEHYFPMRFYGIAALKTYAEELGMTHKEQRRLEEHRCRGRRAASREEWFRQCEAYRKSNVRQKIEAEEAKCREAGCMGHDIKTRVHDKIVGWQMRLQALKNLRAIKEEEGKSAFSRAQYRFKEVWEEYGSEALGLFKEAWKSSFWPLAILLTAAATLLALPVVLAQSIVYFMSGFILSRGNLNKIEDTVNNVISAVADGASAAASMCSCFLGCINSFWGKKLLWALGLYGIVFAFCSKCRM